MSSKAATRVAAIVNTMGQKSGFASAVEASKPFRAVWIDSSDKGKTQTTIVKSDVALKDLPNVVKDGDSAVVQIDYSSINYKDGLAITGKGKIVRNFPHVPGIDCAGILVEPGNSKTLKKGDKVVLTGYGFGERVWGGLSEFAKVDPKWLVKLPDNLSPLQAMAIGTAGFTAMQCVLALEEHGIKSGDIIVTGAAGGVGSVAVSILAKKGYKVHAVTGRPDTQGDFLKALGATEIIPRASLEAPGKPLDKETFDGGIDTVGGQILVNVISKIKYGGSVAACGLAGSNAMPNATVFPHILRGVNLLGIDSVMCPAPRRQYVWDKLGQDLDLSKLQSLTHVYPLSEVVQKADDIVAGKIAGRTVIDVKK